MLSPAAPPLPRHLVEHLPAEIQQAFRALASYDQRHLIAVAHDLESSGLPRHVVLAGLLHDIGKSRRVSVVDRVAKVVCTRLAPRLLLRIACLDRPPRLLEGLHLLLRHAARGADMLTEAGMPADVTWLVRHHEHDIADADLHALKAADGRN